MENLHYECWTDGVLQVYVLPRLNLVLELRAALRKQHEQLLVSAHGRLLELSSERTQPAETTHVNAEQDLPAASLPYVRHIRSTLSGAQEQRMTFEDLVKALGEQLPWLQNNLHYQVCSLLLLAISETHSSRCST